MCLLQKSLYGHPESGGHWEKHLTKTITFLGGKPIENHPSSFWFADLKILLTVYVDDLLASGPTENLPTLWDKLANCEFPIHLGEPEEVNRFLGRNHVFESL